MGIQSFSSGHFELDHIFICTDVNAPVAQRLIDFGLLEGRSNTHPGQGTTNRCFFFQNTMLELLWVHDPVEAQTPLTQTTRLWERWRDRSLYDEVICAHSFSPFGIALRPMQPDCSLLPFFGWHYKPTYLPDPLTIWIGDDSDNIKAVTQMGIVSVLNGDRHLIEIGFDGEKQGQSIDFSPDLPLVFHW